MSFALPLLWYAHGRSFAAFLVAGLPRAAAREALSEIDQQVFVAFDGIYRRHRELDMS